MGSFTPVKMRVSARTWSICGCGDKQERRTDLFSLSLTREKTTRLSEVETYRHVKMTSVVSHFQLVFTLSSKIMCVKSLGANLAAKKLNFTEPTLYWKVLCCVIQILVFMGSLQNALCGRNMAWKDV